MGGPGSRRYHHCADRGREELSFLSREQLGPKTCKYAPQTCFGLFGVQQPTSSPSSSFPDGGFIPLSDCSGAKASLFTGAALNFECVGGWEFLITTPYQSRLGNTVDIHLAVWRRWVEPQAPMSRLPSCESFVHHTEDKSMYRLGGLCVFSGRQSKISHPGRELVPVELHLCCLFCENMYKSFLILPKAAFPKSSKSRDDRLQPILLC